MYDATLAAAPAANLIRPTIAVVGSGPSGCYVAQFLAKQWPDAEIAIFESLPAPYGLIRYGVAADHQGAKGVARQFDRMFTKGGVRFVGNVSVGRDIEFDQLASNFDIVVLATGLPEDRKLDIPQESATRVIGAGALIRALNGFPARTLLRHQAGAHVPLGRRLAVVGMGNVAVDVVRLLSKNHDGFVGSDIDDEMLRELRPEPPESIDVISRSAVTEAKCDLAMLREVVSLSHVEIVVTGLRDNDGGPIADLLRPYTYATSATAPDLGAQHTRLRLHFGVAPERIENSHGCTLLRARRQYGDRQPVTFAADTVITAVGFTGGPSDDRSCPSSAWSGPHVYRVGWLRRGPKGTIPENRKDAQQVVDAIVNDVSSGRIALGRPGFDAVAPRLDGQVVNFAGWQRIEMHERQAAHTDRCRRKIIDIDTMLSIATSGEKSATTT
ncbi:FAD-dependent oxidoreductase [Mycolicibacterium brisbanense]|uniref:ferredoxin--NADP(+) reductase n=1 Tax=Mycolicibacterium brisbanense TaxID=146020 RepID=A0A100W6X8_9MYCO|nr:FAD-dependent oxidoreductase [Mycolicibacterium brisbanense]MCV7162144.1 FAD-dependent oxidoreductase [Mycolicibacterium brisbanense]GAS92801.1 cindoxin reductase [Mycolicibacterium brisbanense]